MGKGRRIFQKANLQNAILAKTQVVIALSPRCVSSQVGWAGAFRNKKNITYMLENGGNVKTALEADKKHR